jgi:hypothetical protein
MFAHPLPYWALFVGRTDSVLVEKEMPPAREAGGVLLNAMSHPEYRRILLLDCFEEPHDRADYLEDRAKYYRLPIERFRSLIKIAGNTPRITTASPYGVHASDIAITSRRRRGARTHVSSDIVSRR